MDLNFIFGIKLGKKHKEHIHDCINNIIVEKNKFPDEKKLATMFNIILICIMDCLTPRELEEETLTQQT